MEKIKIKFEDYKSCKVVVKMAKDSGISNVSYKRGLMGGNYLITTRDNGEKIDEVIRRYDKIKSQEDVYHMNSAVVNEIVDDYDDYDDYDENDE